MTGAATEESGRQRRPIRTLLANREFAYIWVAGGLTGIVRWLQLLVMGIYTFEITGSPLLVSMVPMLWMLPLALCGPWAGVIADRVNRKYLYLVALTMVTGMSVTMAVLAGVSTLTFTHIAVASVVRWRMWNTRKARIARIGVQPAGVQPARDG